MKGLLKTIWTYILAFTVNIKKTAEQSNRAESAEQLDHFFRNTYR